MKNKQLIGGITVIILALLLAPYFIGNMARDTISQQAEEVSKIPGYTLEVREYDQGWFTSRAVLAYGFDQHTLKIMMPQKSADEFDQKTFAALEEGLVFDVTVAHGPITFQDGLNIALLTMAGQMRDIDHKSYWEFKKKAGLESLADLKAKVSLGGTTTIAAHNPAFKADFSENDENLVIESAGMDIQATINAAMDEYDATLSIEKMTVAGTLGSLIIEKVTAQSYGEKINDDLWTGKGTSSIGQFSFKGPRNIYISVENFVNDYDFGKESETDLTLHWNASLEDLMTHEIALKNVKLDLDLNHLDTEAVTDYVQSIKQSYEATTSEQETPAQAAARIQAIASRVGEKLIKNSPELIVNNLAFNMGGGFFSSDASLSINGEGLDNIKELSDPKALNRRLINMANIKFDKKLAIAFATIGMKTQMAAGGMDINALPKEQFNQMVTVQTSTMLQTFINQGYLTQDGENFATTFKMKDGIRLINGKALPIPGM